MFFSEKKETFFSESDLSMLFKKISQNFAQWMSQKQIFKNIKCPRFGLGRFGLILKIQTQVRQVRGSIFQRFGGSRFGIFRFDPRLVFSQDKFQIIFEIRRLRAPQNYHQTMWNFKIDEIRLKPYVAQTCICRIDPHTPAHTHTHPCTPVQNRENPHKFVHTHNTCTNHMKLE